MDAGSSRGSCSHCLCVYPLMKASYKGRPIREMAFSSRFFGSAMKSRAISASRKAAASAGRRFFPSIKGINGAQVDGHGINLAIVGNEHLMLITGKFPEPVDILPDLRQRRMEDVRAVAVTFNASFLVQRGMTVAADMIAPVDDGGILKR